MIKKKCFGFKYDTYIVIGEGAVTGTIEVYDNTLTLVQTISGAHSDQVNHLKLLPNGNFASCSDDNTVIIWNPTRNPSSKVLTYTSHTSNVMGLESLTSTLIASGSQDSTLRIWNINTGATLININVGVQVWGLRLLLNSFLASGHSDGSIKVWFYTTGTLQYTLSGGHTDTVTDIETISTTVIASSSKDFNVVIWNLISRTVTSTLIGHTDQVYSLKLLSVNLLASGSNDKSVKFWDVTTGTIVRTLSPVNADWVKWSLNLYDTNTLITGSLDKTMDFFQISTGKLCRSITANIVIKSLLFVGNRKIFLIHLSLLLPSIHEKDINFKNRKNYFIFNY